MQDYKKIWVNDIEEKDFYEFPFASKWIGMNILSIDPETVIVDPLYKDLILTLQEENFKVIQTPLTHARTLGGGFHCVTCDLERE
jgi:N-dimethylarginine dimethylaminohydrolase